MVEPRRDGRRERLGIAKATAASGALALCNDRDLTPVADIVVSRGEQVEFRNLR